MADNEGQEAQGAAEPQAQEETQEAQTFSADYVKELRDEAKGWRLKVRDLEKQVKGLTDTAEAGKRAELEEQGKYKEIADDAMSKLNHLQGVEAENKRYVESLGALLEAQKEGLPDYITDLLEKMDVIDQLEWLGKNRQAVNGEATETPDAQPAQVTRFNPIGGESPQENDAQRIARLYNQTTGVSPIG